MCSSLTNSSRRDDLHSAAGLVSDNRLSSSARYCINTGSRFTGKLVLTELQVSHCCGWHGSTDLPISTGLRALEGREWSGRVEEEGGEMKLWEADLGTVMK